VVRPRSYRVIYYFDTSALGIRHQFFYRVTSQQSDKPAKHKKKKQRGNKNPENKNQREKKKKKKEEIKRDRRSAKGVLFIHTSPQRHPIS
jgi:hypothetical protein